MGHMKFITMLIKGGEYKDFQKSYLKAKNEFTHNDRTFDTHYGKAVCELVNRSATK
jgi:hypothetical protein